MATETPQLDAPSTREKARNVAFAILANTKARAGLLLLTPIVAVSLLGPTVTPHDPLQTHAVDRLAGPGGEYLLGTDHMGRDILSRVIIGGRTTLFLGFTATALALAGGVPIGLVSGYSGGRLDEFLMRVMDMVMSIPTLLLGVLILSILPQNIWNAIVAVGIVYTPRIARVTRSATLSVSQEDFVLRAKARGESRVYILGREILPNIAPPVLVEGSIRVGFAILVGASLSFIGLGAQPPFPDWGFMVATARNYIWQSPWFIIWPSLAIVTTIFGINLLGDGLRDVFDTKGMTDGEA